MIHTSRDKVPPERAEKATTRPPDVEINILLLPLTVFNHIYPNRSIVSFSVQKIPDTVQYPAHSMR